MRLVLLFILLFRDTPVEDGHAFRWFKNLAKSGKKTRVLTYYLVKISASITLLKDLQHINHVP